MRAGLFFLIISSLALGSTVEYFSDRPRNFKSLLADPREGQLRVGCLYSDSNHSYLDLTMGGQLNLANFTFEDELLLNVAIKGLVASRFQYGSISFDLQNSDFIGGIVTSLGKKSQFIELYLSHQSSHHGDDVISQNPSLFRNFSFESIRFLYSKDLLTPLRVYGGTQWLLRADPESLLKKWRVILGAELTFSFLPDLFVASHANFKQENRWTPDLAFVVGYYLGETAKIQRKQRIFFELTHGYSVMGQFSEQKETSAFLGFGFTL